MLTIKSANPFSGTYDVKITNIFILDGFIYIRTTEFPLVKLIEVYNDLLWCSHKLISFYFYENFMPIFKIEVELVDIIIMEEDKRTVLMRVKLYENS